MRAESELRLIYNLCYATALYIILLLIYVMYIPHTPVQEATCRPNSPRGPNIALGPRLHASWRAPGQSPQGPPWSALVLLGPGELVAQIKKNEIKYPQIISFDSLI